MPKCAECGKWGAFLKLTGGGLCCSCELERLLAENKDFNISRCYHASLPNNYIFFIGIDDRFKRFAVCVQPVNERFRLAIFNYGDLLDFRMEKSEATLNRCNTCMMSIYLNSLVIPQITFYFINSPVQIGSDQYNYAIQSANDIYGLLTYIKHNA